MENKKLYQKALGKFGGATQTLMMFEEMSELQKELCKNARGKNNRENIAEEIADVQIMLNQMIIFYNVETAVNDYIQIKHTRLSNLVSDKNGCENK